MSSSTLPSRSIPRILLLACVLVSTVAAQPQPVHCSFVPEEGAWDNPDNWGCREGEETIYRVPGAGDQASIGEDQRVTLTGEVTAGHVSVRGELTGSGDLRILHSLAVSGILSGGGRVFVEGGALLHLTRFGTRTPTIDRTIVNEGLVRWTSASVEGTGRILNESRIEMQPIPDQGDLMIFSLDIENKLGSGLLIAPGSEILRARTSSSLQRAAR